MPLSWDQSGNSSLSINIQDIQQLAVDSGFVFPNTGPELPLSRRAHLQGLFEVYKVNSASSFIKLFTSTRLLPPWEAANSKIRKPQLAATWTVQETSSAVYIGQLCDGKRQGHGLLLTKGTPCVLYIGSFQNAKQQGFGELLSSRGEAYQGHFEEGLMWGPACYIFPRPALQEGAPSGRAMIKFEGMFNGRPQGKGVLFWDDGEEEAGEFDGSTCQRQLPTEQCEGVLMVANSNAQQAREQSKCIKRELISQHLWEQAKELIAFVSDGFLQ